MLEFLANQPGEARSAGSRPLKGQHKAWLPRPSTAERRDRIAHLSRITASSYGRPLLPRDITPRSAPVKLAPLNDRVHSLSMEDEDTDTNDESTVNDGERRHSSGPGTRAGGMLPPDALKPFRDGGSHTIKQSKSTSSLIRPLRLGAPDALKPLRDGGSQPLKQCKSTASPLTRPLGSSQGGAMAPLKNDSKATENTNEKRTQPAVNTKAARLPRLPRPPGPEVQEKLSSFNLMKESARQRIFRIVYGLSKTSTLRDHLARCVHSYSRNSQTYS